MWFAYALALGSLIFFGIKYMLSGADEKANLKGMLPKYLIGIVAILFCFTIATFVADIAGNDPAEDIIEVGEEAGNHFTGIVENDDEGETSDKSDDKNSDEDVDKYPGSTTHQTGAGTTVGGGGGKF